MGLSHRITSSIAHLCIAQARRSSAWSPSGGARLLLASSDPLLAQRAGLCVSSTPRKLSDIVPRVEIVKIIDQNAWCPRLERALQPFAGSLTHNLVREVIQSQVQDATAINFFNWAATQEGFEPGYELVACCAERWTNWRGPYSRDSLLMEFTAMRSRGLKIADATWAVVICATILKKDIMVGHNLLLTLQHEGRMRQVLSFEAVQGCLTTYFAYLTRIRRTDLVYQHYGQMVKAGVVPDKRMNTVYMKLLCSTGKLDNAEDLLTEMAEKGQDPDAVTYYILIAGFCRAKRINDALHILSTMKMRGCDRDVRIYTSLIKFLLFEKREQEAQQMFRQMADDGCPPDAVTYHVVLKHLLVDGKIDHALDLFGKMAKDGCKPDILTYNSLVSGLFRDGRLQEALELIDEMKKEGCTPDAAFYDNVVLELYRLNVLDHAVNMMREMLDKGHMPRQSTFEFLVRSLVSAGKIAEVAELRVKVARQASKDLML